MKEKLRTTSFWLGLSASAVLVCDMIADVFGFNVCSQSVEKIILTICSVLILCGFVTKKSTSDKGIIDKDDLLNDINKNTKE